jgi:hypothetical protein
MLATKFPPATARAINIWITSGRVIENTISKASRNHPKYSDF